MCFRQLSTCWTDLDGAAVTSPAEKQTGENMNQNRVQEELRGSAVSQFCRVTCSSPSLSCRTRCCRERRSWPGCRTRTTNSESSSTRLLSETWKRRRRSVNIRAADTNRETLFITSFQIRLGSRSFQRLELCHLHQQSGAELDRKE